MGSRSPFEKTTDRRVRYARGLLSAGLVADALAELQAIDREDAERRDVLSLRLEVQLAARDWAQAAHVGRVLTARFPEAESGWVGLAYALREMGRMGEARDVLLRAETDHGHSSPLVHYNLACYYSLAGEHAVARGFLAQACRMAASLEQKAFEDPDLKPLWA